MDPRGFGDNRDEKLKNYRTVRNQIVQKIKERFVEK
jgi:hypothetical protein